MAPAVNIKSFERVIPMIYAYTHPNYPPHQGWTKIGYTDKQSVEERVRQQNHTAGIDYKILWRDNAMYKDGSGEYFMDHDFHRYLTRYRNVERDKGREWFHIDGKTSQSMFFDFANREIPVSDTASDYILRREQAEAVRMTRKYFENGGEEFLWNAKPRFGKTLSAYDLVRQMGFTKVLIVTNRPSISNSWADDFQKFIAWRKELCFVSDTDALSGHPGVLSRDTYISSMRGEDDTRGMIAFESLQGLKGSVYFGGKFDKLKWMSQLEFDLLIIDESQEGVDTMKTERAFRNVKRKHTLYLSGTPFKQLASDQFSKEQIYNWSYADEQEAKDNWPDDADYNPYAALPKLSMFTYQLSNMIYEQVQKGLDLSGEDGTVDYAFDLNEFFITNDSGKFVHEDEIKKFLHALSTQEKYPYSTPELRKELAHTMWYLNRVASAKALAKLLHDDPVFKDYEVVIAAGDGKSDDDDKAASAAIDRVRKAIATHDKTITLTVGQLTVGITIPEWSGVLMLCNMQSPSSYMQAAFRAQNPCTYTDADGTRYRKETAYVFDFDPARTLIIFDEFANNLSPETVAGRGTGEDREKNIKRLLNFFPVLGEDDEGTMIELDAKAVLSIPRKLKSQEVVRHGFMSNFLFQNISNVFGAPAVVRQIVEKLTPAHEDPKKKRDAIEDIDKVDVNADGEVEIPSERIIGTAAGLFGEKVYETAQADVDPLIATVSTSTDTDAVRQKMDDIISTVKETVKTTFVAPVVEQYDIKKSAQKRIESQVDTAIERDLSRLRDDYMQQAQIAQAELERKRQEAFGNQTEIKKAEDDYAAAMGDAMKALTETIQETVQKTITEKPKEVIEQVEKAKAEEEKKTVEDSVRDHLRGFSRTIPSFIMAYGDENLTLGNFDDYTEDDVFLEVTGITEADFRFLRDGGDYTNEETGETEHFAGHLFDEVVFNDSIAEFWRKKQQLADYFDETQDEDIFDYIPPQKTNQIFTPKWVVKKMVDQLEEQNPGCFDDPNKTFADLYMKSGLYITEIVKRLFRSKKMKALYPDDTERVRHILTKQVYGMAPTRIIYLIATNYIFGFDETLKAETKNFVQADAAEAAKNDTLAKLVEKHFG